MNPRTCLAGVCLSLSLIGSVPAASIPAPPGLVGWWPGDGSGADIVGGRTATLTNGATFASAQVGQGFRFDGTNDFAQVAHASALNAPLSGNWSFEFWMLRTKAGTNLNVLSKATGCPGTPNYSVAFDSFIPAVPTNVWLHWAQVYTNGTRVIYTNGVVFHTLGGGAGPATTNAAPLTFAHSGSCPDTNKFGGLLDEISLYNRALSAAEVGAIVAAGPDGKDKSLVPPLVSVWGATSNTVFRNTPLTLTARILNGAAVTGWQWYQNGSPLPGATNAQLVIPALTNAGNFNYYVIVTNDYALRSSTNTIFVNVIGVDARVVAPLARWHFDEEPGSTNTLDSSGQGLHGVLSPAGATFTTEARSGRALSLDRASGGLVNMGNVLNLTLTDFTIVLWAKLGTNNLHNAPGPVPNPRLLGKDSTTNGLDYYVGVNAGNSGNGVAGTLDKAHFTASRTNFLAPAVTTNNVTDSQWHQIVCIHRLGVTNEIYLDGTPFEGRGTGTGFLVDNDAPFLVGGVTVSNVPTATLNGLIDEVQIFDRVLTPAQINYLYTDAASEGVGESTFGPNVYVWNEPAGGNWNNAAHWLPPGVPGAMDTAYITNLNFAATVTVSTPVTVNNLFLGTGPSVITNRLDVNTNFTVQSMARIGNNGWFRHSGPVTVNGAWTNAGFYQWLDSPLLGSLFVNEAAGRLQTRSAGGSTLGVGLFENYGHFLVASDDVGVFFRTGTIFRNQPGGEVQLALPCFGFQNASGATGTRVENYGLIRATASVPSCPSYLTVHLINHGTLRQETAGWYIGSGTNYGTIESSSAAHGFSTVSADPFVFEAGTIFGVPTPRLFAGGHFMFNTPVSFSATVLHVGDASDGASTTAPALTLNADFHFGGEIEVGSGRVNITNASVAVSVGEISLYDDGVSGNPNAYLTNNTRITANRFTQSFGTADHAGLLTVRSNWSFNGGTLRGQGGVVSLQPGAIGTFGGTAAKTISSQTVSNLGSVTASDTVTFVNGATWWNEPGSVFHTTGGVLDDTGTAGFFYNRGAVAHPAAGLGSGGIDLIFTNAGGTVSAQFGTLAIGRFTQTAGRTELRGGHLSGRLDLRGGTLDGAGDVGHLNNYAGVFPGNTLGTLRATGGFTNHASGVYHMQIAGPATNQHDRFFVSGGVNLDGTLNVTFTNGFFPTVGHSYTAMTWTARSGAFSQILTPSYEFEIIYLPNALVLRASNSLPAVTLTAAGGGTQLVCTPFRLNAAASDLDGVITNLSLFWSGSEIARSSGGALATKLETDFPGTILIAAVARDNRGGSFGVTQAVEIATGPLHVLTLGGMRTNGFKICMAGELGAEYLMHQSTNVAAAFTNWAPLGPMEFTNGIWRFIDPTTNRFESYYRARQQ